MWEGFYLESLEFGLARSAFSSVDVGAGIDGSSGCDGGNRRGTAGRG